MVRVEFLRPDIKRKYKDFKRPKSELAEKLYKDLVDYFSGEKVKFDYDVSLKTAFIRKVLNEVRRIKYGETKTYGEIARKLNTSPRAVGQALKANPAPIIIPCHRVIAKRGLGGFSQGLNVKLELLKLEDII